MSTHSRLPLLLLFLLAFLVSPLETQAEPGTEESPWTFDFAFQQYILPGEADLSIPAASVGWNDWVFLGRYNYESRDAGSVWLGQTFSFGDEAESNDNSWELYLTPLVGGIMGSIHGVATGGLIEASWRRFEFYSELEYVFDSRSRDNNFFYSWSQITFKVVDWLNIGVVGSRTRAYDSAVELDRGLIVELNFENATISCTVLNVEDNPITILGLEFSL